MFKAFKLATSIPFPDLRLQRADDGTISYDINVLQNLCAENGINADLIASSEDNVSELLIAWYVSWRRSGGDADQTMEQLLAEISTEDEHGLINVQRGGGLQ